MHWQDQKCAWRSAATGNGGIRGATLNEVVLLNCVYYALRVELEGPGDVSV